MREKKTGEKEWVAVGVEDEAHRKFQATRPGASSVIRQARTTSPHQSFTADFVSALRHGLWPFLSRQLRPRILIVMLKSTYTPPPPLPPGWSEHRAPSGWSALSSFRKTWLTVNSQVICTIIMPLQSSQHTQDRRCKLLNLLPLPQHPHIFSHNTRPRHYRLFPRHRTDRRQALGPAQDNLANRIMARVAAASEVEKVTKTAGDGYPKTDQRKSILYLAAHHGSL